MEPASSIAGQDGFFEAISLGETCSVKFQIARRLHRAAYPDGDAAAVRAALATGRAGQVFKRHIFDWQITPVEAAVAYLEHDFTGVFERGDLMVSPDGEVVHRELRTRHPHDFHPTDPTDPTAGLTEADVDAQYAAARSRFDHLTARFRAHLRRPGRFLYVLNRWPGPSVTRRLLDCLSAQADHHRLRLLCADTSMDAANLAPADDRVAVAPLPARIDKPVALQWEGDDDAWDVIFAGFPIRHFGEPFSAHLRLLRKAPPPGVRPLEIAVKQPPDWTAVPLPTVVSVPEAAWTYGGISGAIFAPEGGVSGVVDVGIEVLEGQVSIALTTLDGGRLIGSAQALSAGEGPVSAQLPVPGGVDQAHLLFRNAGEEGIGGRALIRWIGLREPGRWP